jgi:hypothetical protein
VLTEGPPLRASGAFSDIGLERTATRPATNSPSAASMLSNPTVSRAGTPWNRAGFVADHRPLLLRAPDYVLMLRRAWISGTSSTGVRRDAPHADRRAIHRIARGRTGLRALASARQHRLEHEPRDAAEIHRRYPVFEIEDD